VSAASSRASALALFGPYCRRELMFADDRALFEHSDFSRYILMRARDDSPGLREMLLDIDREVEGLGFERLKHDRTTTVGVASRDGRRLVIKRYNTKNAWHFVRRSMRRSRAHNCFDFAFELLRNDIPTAAPISCIEARLGPLKGRSWLVTEYVDGPVCLDYVLGKASQQEAAEIAARLERVFRKLAALKITHGDMKASNFVLRENRFPVLIDLDGMRRHTSDATYEAAHRRDRERFMKNWRERPELALCFSRVSW
jgi:serine/threonine protein kinase